MNTIQGDTTSETKLERPEWDSASGKWTFAKDIVGAFAMWACRQSPYGVPDGLERVCKLLHEGLQKAVAWDVNGMKEVSLKEIDQLLRDILFDKGIAEFDAWNQSEVGDVHHVFVSRYDHPDREHDFIDLDALARNVCMTIRDERRIENKP